MNSKQLKIQLMLLLTVIFLGNSLFIFDTSAFTYSNPSTTPLWTYSTEKQYISAVSISSDGNYIAAASENLVYDISIKANGTLFLFDNLNSTIKSPLWNYSISNSFFSLAISLNGSHIVAGGGYFDATVYLFNNSKSSPEWAYPAYGWVYDVAIADNYIAAACGQRYKALFFKTTDSSPTKSYSTTGITLRTAISSNGSFMAATDNTANLYFFNTSKSSPDWTFTLSGDMSVALSISANGNYVASGGDKVYLFNKSASIPIWTYDTSDDITSIKISKDGNYIVAGSSYSDRSIYLFDRLSSIPEWIYTTRGEISSVAISTNGDYIAALSTDNFIYLFNRSSSIPVWRYRLDGYPTASYDYGLDISSDGKYIVVGGRHFVYLFDRDIIRAPKLIIPGYNLPLMLIIIGVIFFTNFIAVFHNFKKHKARLQIK